jgi:hypothetical protein
MTVLMHGTDLQIPVVPPTRAERALARQIKELWTLLQEREWEKHLNEPELIGVRFYLGEKLLGMKELLGLCGRSEQWPIFLRRRRIPQAAAEQLISEQEACG